MGRYKDGSYHVGSMIFAAVPETEGEGAFDYSLAGSGVLEKAPLEWWAALELVTRDAE